MMKRRWLALKLVVGAALVWWLLASEQLDPSVYRELGRSDDGALLLAACVAQALALALFVSRWWVLVRIQGLAVPLRDVMHTGMQGIFTSLFIPGNLGIDGIRLLYVRRHHRALALAGLSTLVMDRFVGFAGLVITGLGGGLLYRLLERGTELDLLNQINSAVLACLLLGAGMCAVAPTSLIRWVSRKHLVAKTLTVFSLYRHHTAALSVAMCLAILTQLANALSWWLALQALGAAPGLLAIVAICAALTLIRTLPLVPLGLGVADLAAETLFGWVDVSLGAEAQMMMRALALLTLLLSGLFYYIPEKRKNR